jgi:hypothetical protein
VQQWLKDHDLLVQETLAFAQRLAAGRPARIEALPQDEPARAVEPVPKPYDKLFEREEIRQRLAGFKATQHKFQREREEYYRMTMAKVRPSRNEA